jgi:hypothetical protein
VHAVAGRLPQRPNDLLQRTCTAPRLTECHAPLSAPPWWFRDSSPDSSALKFAAGEAHCDLFATFVNDAAPW